MFFSQNWTRSPFKWWAIIQSDFQYFKLKHDSYAQIDFLVVILQILFHPLSKTGWETGKNFMTPAGKPAQIKKAKIIRFPLF